MYDVITDASQVTVDWLEAVLRRHGCLPGGRGGRTETSLVKVTPPQET
jgi:hypothetical protein